MLFKLPHRHVILSINIFPTVSLKHLMLLLDEKGDDSKDNRYSRKIRCRNLIHFMRETVFLAEDTVKTGFLIFF